MDVRYPLKDLGELAVTEVGFCVGLHWRSVTGRRPPAGMISARCRLAYVLFSGFDPARRFHRLLARRGIARLPQHHIRLVTIPHAGATVVGVAVVAVTSPDSRQPTGYRPAPPHATQPGYQRFFRERAAEQRPRRAWWDDADDDWASDRFDPHDLQPDADYLTRQAEEETERLLDRIEQEYNAKLWWYGVPGRRSVFAPQLKDVSELFAYARRHELPIATIAERNREQQATQWLSEQHARDRQRQAELDADQAEVAAALARPRRGRAHAEDTGWNATVATLRARRALTYVYRDAATGACP